VVYERVLELIDDGEWHDEGELRAVTVYPDAWLHELSLDGHMVVRRSDGTRAVRVRPTDAHPEVSG
jgi:hypothetical protein